MSTECHHADWQNVAVECKVFAPSKRFALLLQNELWCLVGQGLNEAVIQCLIVTYWRNCGCKGQGHLTAQRFCHPITNFLEPRFDRLSEIGVIDTQCAKQLCLIWNDIEGAAAVERADGKHCWFKCRPLTTD